MHNSLETLHKHLLDLATRKMSDLHNPTEQANPTALVIAITRHLDQLSQDFTALYPDKGYTPEQAEEHFSKDVEAAFARSIEAKRLTRELGIGSKPNAHAIGSNGNGVGTHS